MFPADLVLVVLWLAASIIVIYSIQDTTLIRVVLTFPVLFFIPGYCLIAALFPKEGDIGIIERIMLSIGFSIAIVSLIGFGLNFTPWGIQFDTIVISLTIFTWIVILIAHYQRAILLSEDRFRIPFFVITGRIRQEFLPAGEKRIDRLLSIVLAFVMIATMITTVYVIVLPKEGERFTEFFILGDKQKAADYPDTIIIGKNYPMYLGVGNQEYQNVTYTIETWIVRTKFDTITNTSSITAEDSLDRMTLVLAHNETSIIPYNLSVKKTGYNRVDFLLFNETVPNFDVTGSDRINASYRYLHLWVTVV